VTCCRYPLLRDIVDFYVNPDPRGRSYMVQSVHDGTWHVPYSCGDEICGYEGHGIGASRGRSKLDFNAQGLDPMEDMGFVRMALGKAGFALFSLQQHTDPFFAVLTPLALQAARSGWRVGATRPAQAPHVGGAWSSLRNGVRAEALGRSVGRPPATRVLAPRFDPLEGSHAHSVRNLCRCRTCVSLSRCQTQFFCAYDGCVCKS
jgi:hypothetical protein